MRRCLVRKSADTYLRAHEKVSTSEGKENKEEKVQGIAEEN